MKIVEERTGQVHDYSRKRGVQHSEIILPEGGTVERSKFWNALEKHHKRGDAVLSREIEVSLPAELKKEERQALAIGYARELANRYGVAADVALHAPRTITDREFKNDPNQYFEIDESGRRHNGNWHAHIMLSACRVSPTGELGKKAVELDPIHCQRAKIENMADRERVRWSQLANDALQRAGHRERIDHRSHAARELAAAPSQHLGPNLAAIKRRGGYSPLLEKMNLEIQIRLNEAKKKGEIERELQDLTTRIIALDTSIQKAISIRDVYLKEQKMLKVKESTLSVEELRAKSRAAAAANANSLQQSSKIILTQPSNSMKETFK